MTSRKKVFNFYHHHDLWEEAKAGLWRRPTGTERDYLIAKCSEFMANTDAFREAMYQAIEEWPISCEVNFTSRNNNRQAWLGHAACCIAIDCPEEPTRAAWWTLTKKQRDDADAAAAEVIEEWERRYVEGQCQKIESDFPAPENQPGEVGLGATDKITIDITDEITLSKTRKEWAVIRAKISNGMRHTKSGGKRSDDPRCPCGSNTLKRAKTRGFQCCRQSGISESDIAVARQSL